MSRIKTGKEGQKSRETHGYLMTGIDFTGRKPECVRDLRNLVEDESLTRFDLAVMSAMYGLWKEKTEQGYDVCSMTYQQICRTMNGISGTKRVCTATTESVRRSVEKLSRLWVHVETADGNMIALTAFGQNEPIGMERAENLLSVIRCDEVYHGHSIAGITLLRCPVLCRYAEAAGRMKEIPGGLWNINTETGKQLRIMERTIAFRDTLTEYVITKKHRKGKDFCVELKEITENAGISFESLSRKRKQRDRELIGMILDCFVKAGYLRGFTIDLETKMVEFQV
ncbi:hypothetical protein DXD54_08455 [Clostridium sp. TM06-18]|nr:hypothetical protein [Clostridium sp. TM06-18]RHU37212.1 hypothetical protein DXD54_08455 [Clostridium sp. TM06-18]